MITQLNPSIVSQFQSFTLSGLTFHGYGIIIGLSICIASLLFIRLSPHSIRDHKHLIYLIACTILLGTLGGRIGYAITHPSEFDSIIAILEIWNGGTTIFGVLCGGVAGVVIGHRMFRIPGSVVSVIDTAVPAVSIGQAIGRWANFVNQELYGLPTTSSWGMYIEPKHRIPKYESTETFHPVFLYESVLMIILAVILIPILQKSRKDNNIGTATAVYFMGYGAIRLMMEQIRIDSIPYICGINLAEIVSFLSLMSGGILFYYVQRKHRK